MFITKTLALGLLGLQTVVGLPTGVADQSIAKRAGTSSLDTRAAIDWPGAARIKLSQISEDLSAGNAEKVEPKGDEAKDISDDDWFVKTTGNFENEIAVYQSINGQDIAPEFLALIEAEDSDDVIGFAIKNIDGSQAEDDDKVKAVELIEKLHGAGWSHGDAHKGNFIKTTFSMYLIDFENSVKDDEDAQGEDFAMIDQEFGFEDDGGDDGIVEEVVDWITKA